MPSKVKSFTKRVTVSNDSEFLVRILHHELYEARFLPFEFFGKATDLVDGHAILTATTTERSESGMSIEQRLRDDQKTAMKTRDAATLNAIRSIQTEVATAKAAPGFKGESDDELFIKVIGTYVKRITKSKAEYDTMGERGAEQADKLGFEIAYLDQYLPKKLNEQDTRMLIEQTMADIGADASMPAGQIVGAVMRSGRDLDGALVNRLVRETLEG